MRRIRLVGIAIAVCSALGFADAQIPTQMSYQGVLTDGSGTPVTDGSHSLAFALYSASSGGAALWSETQASVQTTNGVLNVVMGSVTPIGISFDGPLWLGIAVDGGAELTPRVELTTSPYAFHAKSVDDNAVTSAKIADGSVGSADIADGSIAATDVASGQVVTGVNSLTDAVTLAAGSNVTITPAGNTLTIAASSSAANTLDMAYDQGGAGVGRTITADNGAVDVQGADGLTVNGGVGIGTTALQGGKLRVSTGSGTTPALLMSNAEGIWGRNAADANSMFIVGTDASDRIQFGEVGGAAPNQGMTFQTGGSERLRIDNAGNVGIGTASPTQGLTLAAGKNILMTRPAGIQWNGSNEMIYADDGGLATAGTIHIKGGGAERVSVEPGGNVGIGTTAPSARLHVNNGSLLLDGTTGAIPATGAGTRIMWYPAKAAFRAGVVTGTHWDDANVGTNSTVGGGQNNQAGGADATISGGTTNNAGGAQATIAGGTTNTANGAQATVGGGTTNTASGTQATVPRGGRQHRSRRLQFRGR